MELFEAIKTRRSIRAYTKHVVPSQKIKKIVEAGLLAPSSKNSQPWNFIVIENKKIIKQIADFLINSRNTEAEPSDPATGKIKKGYKSSIKASGEIIKIAPVLIAVENTCPFSGGRKKVRSSKFANAINGHDSEFISLGAAIQNMSLAIHGLDLSTVIICDAIAEEEKIKKLLKLKGDLVAILPIGYPAYKAGSKAVNSVNKVRFIK
mgnify:CR=1 FL=1